MPANARFYAYVAAMSIACGDGWAPVEVPLGTPPDSLSAWNLIRQRDGILEYNTRTLAYDLNTPLFSDYAQKDRAIYVPEGSAASFREAGVFDMPVGTTLLKTFSFPADLRAPTDDVRRIETRVLVRTGSGWRAWPYIWNDDQDDAVLEVEGGVQTISLIDKSGQETSFPYLVPQRNQCADCHELDHPEDGKGIVPIGPTARNLHRPALMVDDGANQLEVLAREGLLSGLPDVNAVAPATDWAAFAAGGLDGRPYEDLDRAARDYLDVNCASCHNPRGVNGITSQLFLNWDNTDRFHLGVCKKPGSAAKGTGGRTWDIMPGDADASILFYRVQTEDVGSMMPEIGRSLAHTEGVDLLKVWIDGMPDAPCE
jgi:uncharacterized repeat protein (TIGR03806 family)